MYFILAVAVPTPPPSMAPSQSISETSAVSSKKPFTRINLFSLFCFLFLFFCFCYNTEGGNYNKSKPTSVQCASLNNFHYCAFFGSK